MASSSMEALSVCCQKEKEKRTEKRKKENQTIQPRIQMDPQDKQVQQKRCTPCWNLELDSAMLSFSR